MSFAEGSRTIYKPIRVLFDTPIYERALQICWHMPSYKSMIALMSQLLRLQQKKQLPSEVTAEDMSELLFEQSKRTLRVQLWEFELEGFDADVRPLLQLVWEVNNSMKMRDIEFEARRLLSSPEAVPPHFQHHKIISQALKYAGILTEQQQKGPKSKLLCPMEMILEVLPKVLQSFWLPPPNTCFNMPSQQLSKMAVGVTKAVQDRVSKALSSVLLQATFSSSIRNNMVLSIQEKVRQGYPQDVLVKGLNSFAAEVLNTITDVAVREICALFQPQTPQAVQTPSDEPPLQTAVQNVFDRSLDEIEPEPDSAVVSTPLCPLTSSDEPLAHTAIPEPDSAVVSTPPCPLTSSDEPPAHAASPEPDSAVVFTPPCPLTSSDEPPAHAASPEPDSAVVFTPPCPLTSSDEPPAHTASPEPDSAVVSTPPSPLTPSVEPPAHTASPEPGSAVVFTPPCPLTSSDEPPAHAASPEPDSAVVSTPPCPLTSSDEPSAHTVIQNVFKQSLDEIKNQPILCLEPGSAAVASAPPAVQTPSVEPPANIALEEIEEQRAQTSELDPVVISTTPRPLTPADKPPAISSVQDKLITTVQPVKVDESSNTTTAVKKTKKSRFLKWLKKRICCCCVYGDDMENCSL